MRELLQNAVNGLAVYFQSNHMAVLVLGLLLYVLAAGRCRRPREKKLLGLTAVLLILVIFPVSGACLMLYQTRFYSYPWIWSLVPVTLCIAWGGAQLLWELTGQNRRDGRAGLRLAVGIGVLLALLLLLGNLGRIQTVSEEEKAQRSRAAQVAAYLQEIPQMQETLLWGPRPVLEAARQQTGEIRVLYGRNMWEPEAAAYAYDAYGEEEQRLFDWMEALENEAAESGSDRTDAYAMFTAAGYGARIWVFPAEATERIALACDWLQGEYDLQVQALGEVAGYTIWYCE